MAEAKDFKCNACKKQAVCFVGLNDPDGTMYPKCRKHADEWKMKILFLLLEDELGKNHYVE